MIASRKENSLILSNDNDEDRRLFESCQMKGKRVVNPIIDWENSEILEYAATEKIKMNPLYEQGFCRVGCVGCPMAGKSGRMAEFARYPKYKRLYIMTFDKMLEERAKRGKMTGTWRMGTNGVDVFHWWMEDGVLAGQETLPEFGEMEEHHGATY